MHDEMVRKSMEVWGSKFSASYLLFLCIRREKYHCLEDTVKSFF